MDRDLTDKLRTLLDPGRGTVFPGVANALAARIAEAAGFQAILITGAGVANTYLGVPDIGLTTATEVTEHITAVREACNLPIVADGDTGFGNPINVGRTVRSFERAGANAMLIEDQVFPKRCGHFEGKQVIAQSEMIGKIKAAVDARRNGMLILARTDARAVEGMGRALERMTAYRDAGADILFVEAPLTVDELAQIPREVPGRHICNMVYGGKTPLLPREQLAAMGYGGICYANAMMQAAMLAMRDVAQSLAKNGSLAGIEQAVIPFAERQRMVDHPRYIELEKRYTER